MSTYGTLIAAQGATFYWSMDDVSTPVVDTIGGLNMTEIGTSLTYRKLAAVGTGIDFPSVTNKYLTSASTNTLSYNNTDWSISLFIKWDSRSGNQGIVSKRISSADGRAFSLFLYGNLDGQVYMDLGNNNSRWQTDFLPDIGRLYHIAFTYKYSTNARRFYVDGVLKKAGTDTISRPTAGVSNAAITIGIFGGASSSTFDGVLDEVAIFSTKELSAAEVALQYATATPIYRVHNGTTFVHAEKTIL